MYTFKRLLRKIKNIPYYLKRGIKNIIKWIPIIWSDEDFDYGFLMEIMKFKLKNMEGFFNSEYAWTKDAKKTAEQIKIAVILLDRLHNANYTKLAGGDIKHSMYIENNDKEYLFRHLSKYVFRWWD